MRGSAIADDGEGKAIIAIPSTNQRGGTSKIVNFTQQVLSLEFSSLKRKRSKSAKKLLKKILSFF